jgi:2Fe-2S ferredoxin
MPDEAAHSVHSLKGEIGDDREGEESFLTLNVMMPDGVRHRAEAAPDFSVMELARAYGIPVVADCGGSAVCATCHVRVSDEWLAHLPPPSDEELARLDEIPDADENSRLSCQLRMTDALDGLEVTFQPDSILQRKREHAA